MRPIRRRISGTGGILAATHVPKTAVRSAGSDERRREGREGGKEEEGATNRPTEREAAASFSLWCSSAASIEASQRRHPGSLVR